MPTAFYGRVVTQIGERIKYHLRGRASRRDVMLVERFLHIPKSRRDDIAAAFFKRRRRIND